MEFRWERDVIWRLVSWLYTAFQDDEKSWVVIVPRYPASSIATDIIHIHAPFRMRHTP